MIKTYKGIEYIVYLHNEEILHHYNGYVRIPNDHPWTKILAKAKWFKIGGQRHYHLDYDALPIEVHGGLTFAQKITRNGHKAFPQEFSKGYWIGWDYAHYGDEMFDLQKMKQLDPKLYAIHTSGDYHSHDYVWTEAEVEKECKNVIQQIVDAYEQ